jgi:dipeptidyl aminopeptidase/acylaminoacyl peptidase
VVCCSFLVALAAAPSAQQPADGQAKAPVADFFRAPRLDQPAMSPNGRYLAGAVSVDGGRVQLAVLDIENLGPPKVVAGFPDADVSGLWWVNDERIVFSAIDRDSDSTQTAPGLWAVNRDGSGPRQLISAVRNPRRTFGERSVAIDRRLGSEWRLHSVLRDGSSDVLVLGYPVTLSAVPVGVRLARLDTTTGFSRNLSEGAPEYVTGWVVDRQGRPAAVATVHEGRYRAYLRSPHNARWEKWQDAESIGGEYAIPYWIGADEELLALSRVGDTLALFAVDAKTRELEREPKVRLQGYDFAGTIVYDAEARRLLGVHYETDGLGTAWLDPLMRSTQAAVDALLPATINRIDCERCTSSPVVLVTATSDRQPPIYYLFNRDTKALTSIVASRPWIKAHTMGARTVHRFAARDGMSIPVLVTHPPGKPNGSQPAVMLVHGGPWLRGTHWAWEPEAQFLASRGYVVIEPEFRGSQGYGFKHFRAGWKQWGLAMQDDLADAVQWAAERGWVDATRVCIAGASYGGYATLMGLVRHHDLYQCGIEWVGVSDIELLYSIHWGETSEESRSYSLPVLIGDRVADAAQLKATSPLAQAESIRRPLLMAYGALDLRVPIEHGNYLRDALSKTNKGVEWILYANEGHGWRMLETNTDFWTRVEKFLEQHIGRNRK